MMRKSFFFTGLIVLLSACGTPDNKKQTEDTFNVKGATVSLASSTSPSDFSFISKPFRSSDLSFRISGLITDLDVHAGKHYRKGEVIAQIDPRDFIILKERTEAVYNQAKAEFERIETLYKKDNLSASVYEKARAEYVSAKTTFQTASNQLIDTKLIAPFDGYVGEVYAEKHQDVKTSQPILSFEDINRLKIEVYVPQQIALKADSLKSVQIVFDADPGKEYTAHIEQVSKSTTRNNISYLITAILPNSSDKLLAGMSGKALFPAGNSSEKILTIPGTAICHNPTDGDYVWVINATTSKAEKRKIKIGQLLKGGAVPVLSGLQEGETVSVSGNRFLSDGCDVKLSNY